MFVHVCACLYLFTPPPQVRKLSLIVEGHVTTRGVARRRPGVRNIYFYIYI